MDTPISNWTIEELLKDAGERANIIEESSITSKSDVEDIFKNRGHAIIFHRHSPQPNAIGHWIAIIRNNKTNEVYYFDSLGDEPYNKAIPEVILRKYKKLYINDVPFQPDNTNSCGRHAVMVVALNKIGLTPKQIEHFLKTFDANDYVIKNIRGSASQ